MSRSSLGFHTMALILKLEMKEAQRLTRHFLKYREDKNPIEIYQVDGKGNYSIYRPSVSNSCFLPLHLEIRYHDNIDRGISWVLKCNNRNDDFKSYIVEAKINPKILGGIHDYITAATFDDMEAAITNFDLEAKRISPLLKSFDCYTLKRVDYCINFDVNELAMGCSPDRIMELIRRGNIPTHYKEFMEYDQTAHRMKSKPGSFYLINPSANINCYSKHYALQNHSEERESRGLSPIPQATLDAAQGIIRFEVQCKYNKTYTLSRRAEASGNHDDNKYESLLSHEMCNEVINRYFNKVIGKGDWHTRQNGIRMIESQHYNKQREKRLIDALQLVNQCRSLAKAKEIYQGSDLADFKRTLKELNGLNINPVTIPKEWGIKHIPNLLYAYYDKVQQEKDEKRMIEFQSRCFDEYVKKHGHLPA